MIPFSAIQDIILASGWMGDYSQGGWRIEIRTKDGGIPVTRTYYGPGKKAMESIVDQLVALLSGQDPVR